MRGCTGCGGSRSADDAHGGGAGQSGAVPTGDVVAAVTGVDIPPPLPNLYIYVVYVHIPSSVKPGQAGGSTDGGAQ